MIYHSMTEVVSKMSDKGTIKCPICGKENPQGINFCKYCRYPIDVKKIDEFNKEDLIIHLSNFLDVIKGKDSFFDNKEHEELFDEFFSLNWLRPESALINFTDARILLDFKKNYLKYPLLDLGCGEGLFTSILFGARINRTYDAYESIDFSKTDIYNTYTELPNDFFRVRPSPIGFGVDIKETAVMKANDLGTYDEVRLGDIRKMPFENESVNSVFSNIVDNIKEEDLDIVFEEVNRVLKTGGYFVFTTPTRRFREFLRYYNKAQDFKKQGDMDKCSLFLEFDRGRSEWEPRPLSLWVKLFEKTSFEVVEYVEYGDKNMVQLWDTGFRPFFHHLMGIRNTLIKNDMLLPVKEIVVEIIKNYFLKYTKNQISQNGAFAIIVAKKRAHNEGRK